VTLGQCIALETGGWSLPISWSGYIGNDPETPLSFQVYDGNGDLFLEVPDMTDYTIDGAGNLELGLGTFDGETWTPPTGTWTFVFSDDIDGTASAVLNADAACPPA
jgi:hypothetical protein